MQRTFVMLKPDCVGRRLVGEVVSRIEKKGLKIVGMKLIAVSQDQAKQLYAEHEGKPFHGQLTSFVLSGPVVTMVVEGNEAVAVVRKLLGKTFGHEAEPGTIRGDYGITKTFNIVHGSDSPEKAKKEYSIFFSEKELVGYNIPDERWLADADK